jgi:hypothetical protein
MHYHGMSLLSVVDMNVQTRLLFHFRVAEVVKA